ncbi:MAG: MraZ N-terminal domain containing protein [Xanthobacteraceae bacterium]|nr:MraZ N-terminal domain containing protein [Xanthobacteraceae bacterium]
MPEVEVQNVPPPEALPDGTVRYFLKLGAKGRLLLPAEMRAALGLQEGELVTAWQKDGEVLLHSHLHGLRKIRDEARALAQATGYASDELIAERRAEALKEEEAAVRSMRRSRKRR